MRRDPGLRCMLIHSGRNPNASRANLPSSRTLFCCLLPIARCCRGIIHVGYRIDFVQLRSNRNALPKRKSKGGAAANYLRRELDVELLAGLR